MALTAVVFWLVYVGGVCAAVVYPVVGVALYIFVYHVNPQTQWWGQSFVEAGLRPSWTVAAATMVGILLRRPRLSNGAKQFPLPIVLALALIAYALLTTTWADPTWLPTSARAEKIVKIGIFLLMLMRCVNTPARYSLVFLSWIAGVAYIGYQAAGGGGHVSGGRLTHGLGGPDFAESSDLTVHLVASLPLLGAAFFLGRAWWFRGLVLVAGALTVNAIILTRTRNAVLGILALVCCAVFWLPRGHRGKGLVAVLVGLALSLPLIDPGWWERMATIRDFRQDSSAVNRLTYWKAALDLAWREPLGVGLDQFPRRVERYLPQPAQRSAHNTVLECLAELGVPGAALLFGLMFVTLRRTGALRRAPPLPDADRQITPAPLRLRFHLGWHCATMELAIVGYLASGLFTTRLWAEGFWLLVGLAACLSNIAATERAAVIAAPATPVPGGPEASLPPAWAGSGAVLPAGGGDPPAAPPTGNRV